MIIDKENMPCRSCEKFAEKSVDFFKDLPGGFLSGQCEKEGSFDSSFSFLDMGAQNQESGERRCDIYVHDSRAFW